jgi:hypothetical protein
MTPLKIRKTVIQTAIETTYGTYVPPSDVMFAENINIEPLQGSRIVDDVMCAKLGARPSVMGGEYVAISFDFAFRGGGALGTKPNYDTIMRAGCRSSTVSAGVSVTYALVSDAFESMSLAIYYDGNLHKVSGCRGAISHSGTAGDKAKFTFSGLGLYIAPEAATAPTLDCAGLLTTPPLVVDADGAFTVFGLTPPLQSWAVSFGAAAEYEETINQQEVVLDDRNMTSKLQFKANKLDEYDFFADVLASASGVVNITIGATAGHIVEIQHPIMQLTNIAYTERKSHYDYVLDGSLLPGVGDLDETIIVR